MDKLYTIQEVATKLNLSDKTLRRWEEAGRFSPSRTLGNQRRYTIEDLQILDALKHGTIAKQADLLSIQQASQLCGVSPTTILRWENEGKIHPFITSGSVLS
jgi:excisionase family DNA binding protein